MIKQILRFLPITLIAIALPLIRYIVSKRQLNQANNTGKVDFNIIRQPIFYLIVGIIIILSFLVLSIWSFIDGAWDISIFFFGFVVLGIWMILLQLNWQIEVNEEEFVFRNLFRIKKTYSYEDIKVKNTGSAIKIYKNRKYIVGISGLQENWDCLEKAVRLYRKQQKANERANKLNRPQEEIKKK